MRIRPVQNRVLKRSHGHQMAWRERLSDAPNDVWLVLHGGPGTGANPGLWQPLDGMPVRVLMPDQRGTGNSQPRGCTRRNTVGELLRDLEALRKAAGVDQWSILAGSWGSTLALCYAAAYPGRVQAMVLRGSFAVTRREVWGLLRRVMSTAQRAHVGQIARILPDAQLPAALARVCRVLQSGALGVTALDVLRRWQLAELTMARRGVRQSLLHAMASGRLSLAQRIRRMQANLARQSRQSAARLGARDCRPSERGLWRKYRIQAHYLMHRCFVRPGHLDRTVVRLAQNRVPIHWVHGRFDAICPPTNTRRWKRLVETDEGAVEPVGSVSWPLSGHLGVEPDMLDCLKAVVRTAAGRLPASIDRAAP